MCGICGMLAVADDDGLGPRVRELTRALAHRGPDGEGFWAHGRAGCGLVSADELDRPHRLVLGHRRLSIVDVVGGAQPMANEDGSVWLAFNGEIYNQLDLRRELERCGHRFATRSDTEVVVHGWEEWGIDVLGRLNGIFAIALADTRTREIVLARDPVGVKPLFVGVADGTTWWSSELVAARSVGVLSSEVSAEALKLYLTFRFVPSPYAIHPDVWKVPPSHYVRLGWDDAGRPPRFARYESSIRSARSPRSSAEWGDAIVSGLEAAVTRQLMADVPVASLLSGGVDSTLISHLMACHLDYRPRTFAVGFSSDGERAETEPAGVAAAALGLPQTRVLVDDDDYIAAWPATLSALSEPIANAGMLLLALACAEVGQTHKVVLTGQGADEPLGGYPRHLIERLHTFGRFAPALAAAAAGSAFGSDSGERLRRALAARDTIDRYVEAFAVIPGEEVDRLVRGNGASSRELAREVVSRWLGERDGDSLNQLLRIDARLSLADDLLMVADHVSMRSSVELRVPFLDLELLELVERMPSVYKVSRTGRRKWLYRRHAQRALPESLQVQLRRSAGRLGRKRGFSAPSGRWFADDGGLAPGLRPWQESLFEIDALDPDAVRASSSAGGERARQRLALYSLATWSDGIRREAATGALV
jgi:asparagine synthase (glutamine-hydrolysing)